MEYVQDFKCWYNAVCSNYAENCTNDCIRYREMYHLLQQSNLPQNKWYPVYLDAGIDIDKYERLADIKDDIETYVKNGNNLYICSLITGNGKTSWAIKLLLKYFDSIWAGNGFKTRGVYIHVPTFLLQLKNFSNPLSEQFKQKLLTCDIVIWDEIAYSNDISNYDYNNILAYLESRLMSGKSNIYTSNCNTREQLEKQLGAKLSSRIWATSEIIEFKGKDRR